MIEHLWIFAEDVEEEWGGDRFFFCGVIEWENSLEGKGDLWKIDWNLTGSF
jgi:hypothetical protein